MATCWWLLFGSFLILLKSRSVIRRSWMASSERKRMFRIRKAKGAEEEKKLLESSIPRSTRRSTRWAFNIFKEWQMTRGNKEATLESCAFSFDSKKVQILDTNIVNLTAETLNFWLLRIIQKVVRVNGER